MPRTKIDFHDNRQDAATALSSLREVGLNPGDIGGAWLEDAQAAAEERDRATHRTVDVMDLGRVQFTGWLAEAALQISDAEHTAPLSSILGDHVDAAELDRIRRTLASGGGIVGVRARDAFNPEPA